MSDTNAVVQQAIAETQKLGQGNSEAINYFMHIWQVLVKLFEISPLIIVVIGGLTFLVHHFFLNNFLPAKISYIVSFLLVMFFFPMIAGIILPVVLQ